jgi:hypothetical protein
VAVDDRVSLSIDQALGQIDRLQRELAAALSTAAAQGGQRVVTELQRGESVRIRLPPPDTSAIPGAIDRAIDQADLGIAPTVDPAAASRIGSTIAGAIDAAPAGVSPTVDPGSASRVTGTINQAVQAADNSITVAATITGAAALADACEQARCVDQGLRDSTEASKGLGNAFGKVAGLLAAAGAADFFRDSVLAAADLGEAVSKTNVVFGDSAGIIHDWAADSATSMGLATDEALSFASSIGVLFQSTGNSAEASAEMSTAIIGLSGDLASFSNVAGGAQAVSEGLSAALRGEAEPARQFGIILNDAVVTATAYREGIAAVGTELTAQQRQLATYSEIMRQTSLAQGDFARTADSLPNVLRTLQAEFRNTQVVVGNELLPDVIAFAQTIRGEGLPALQDLAISVVPALIAAMQGLLPLFTTTTTVLVALAPTIEAIALGLQSIPGPALAAAAAAIAVSRSMDTLRLAFLKLVTSPATLGLVAFGVAAAGVLAVMGQAEQKSKALQAQADALANAVFSDERAFTDLEAVLTDYVLTAQTSAFVTGDLADELNAVGQTAQTVAGDLAQGGGGFRAFLQDLVATGDITQDVADDLAEMGTNSIAASRGVGAFGLVTADLDDGVRDLVESFAQEARALNTASRSQAELMVAGGQATQQMFDQAVALATAEDGTVDWARAIQELGSAASAQSQYIERNTLLTQAAASAGHTARQATMEQLAAIRELRGELDPANEAIRLSADQMARLTQELQGGSFTAQEFSALADELGLTVEQLAQAETIAADAISASLDSQAEAMEAHAEIVLEWRDTILAAVPDATAAFEGFNEESSIQEALDRFTIESLGFAAQQQTLNDLLSGGFEDLARFLATQPPAIIAEFAGATNEELAAFEAQIDASNDILAVGAETANTNAGLLAGGIAGGFEDAVTGVEATDLPGVVSAEITDAGAAALDAAGTESGNGAVGDAFAAGQNVARGFENGMAIRELAIWAVGVRLGQAAVAGIQAGAGVRSPSTITRWVGEQLSAGLILGVDDGFDRAALVGAGARAASAFAAGASGALSATGRPGASTTQTVAASALPPIEVLVQVDLDGEPFAAMVRTAQIDERQAQSNSRRAGGRWRSS